VFPRDMVCLRNICVDTLHKGDIDDIIIIIIIIIIIMQYMRTAGEETRI
jgi:hypothetical protein